MPAVCLPSLCVSDVVLSTGKDYPIQASTKDEMLVWVKAIEDAKVRAVQSHMPSLQCMYNHVHSALQNMRKK